MRAALVLVIAVGCGGPALHDPAKPPAGVACGRGASMGEPSAPGDVEPAVLPELNLDPALADALSGAMSADELSRIRDAAGDDAWVMQRVTTLLTDGSALVGHPVGKAADDPSVWHQSRFLGGCMYAAPYEFTVTANGRTSRVRDVPSLAAAVGPIDTAARAVAFVAAVVREVWIPLTGDEVARGLGRGDNPPWSSAVGTDPWIEVEESSGGWIVRAPHQFDCGCNHDVLRRAYWVGRDGAFCDLAEAPLLLVRVDDNSCYD